MSDGRGLTDAVGVENAVERAVERAERVVAPAWPLHSFVTANPLAGFEDRPFHEAVRAGTRLFGGRGYPRPSTFRRAWEDGRIDPETLRTELRAAGFDGTPEASLDRLADTATEGSAETALFTDERTERVNRTLSKWLAAFLDEGRAEWSMPGREEGFFTAFRRVARHDPSVPDAVVTALSAEPTELIAELLADYPRERWPAVLAARLAALPGWSATVQRRADAADAWAAAAPIRVEEYLAVSLTLADALDAPLDPPERVVRALDADGSATESDRLARAWLRAWEATYREELVAAVTRESEAWAASEESAEVESAADVGAASVDTNGASAAAETGVGSATETGASSEPAARLVFCIDTRSEVIRRHVERAGPYETHGYAGFFGVPMRFEPYGDRPAVDARPPILSSRHRVPDRPTDASDPRRARHDRWTGASRRGAALIESLESNAATAFSYVESTGVGYGLGLAARTLVPDRVGSLVDRVRRRVPSPHEFCAPLLGVDADTDSVGDATTHDEHTTHDEDLTHADHAAHDEHTSHAGDAHESDLPVGIPHEDRVAYVAGAFETMGWESFAPLVAFVGHASRTANNPFASSLDCGACAGNPGGPSARVLAAMANDEAVRASLRDRGIDVPAETLFVAGKHDTTTDEITLFDDHVPADRQAELERLREDLATARVTAARERLGETAPARGAADVGDEPVGASAETAGAGDEPVGASGEPVGASEKAAGASENSASASEKAASASEKAASASEKAAGASEEAVVRETRRRATDWAETRPEWGLAGNAAFVVGPRDLTTDLALDGRVFLHSYDPRRDPDGDALEAILTGPMVVTQWINCQYYFASVDPVTYGSGSKTTQNPVGNVAVYQGNGGDVLTGLPTQSVAASVDESYHQPLRLTVVVHAPVERVTNVLAEHDAVATLADNGWLTLVAVDPETHEPRRYTGDGSWTDASAGGLDAAPTVSDD